MLTLIRSSTPRLHLPVMSFRAFGATTAASILMMLVLQIGCMESSRADEAVVASSSLWEVSVRSLPQDSASACCNQELPTRRLEGCCWGDSSEAELLESIRSEPARTVVYVHGNWMSPSDARERAQYLFRALTCQSEEPVRLILLSWPSEKESRIARDVMQKKCLIDSAALHLANFLGRLPEGEVRGMAGYSFGCAIICGALHVSNGGTLHGQTLCLPGNKQYHIQLGLTAPAFDRQALACNGIYRYAMGSVAGVVNLYNSRDPILKHFRFYDTSNPIAAGFTGLLAPANVSQPLSQDIRIAQYDCKAVGRTHAEFDYYRCTAFYALVDNLLSNEN